MRTPTRLALTGALALTLAISGVACSDEDGDGAVTDEELDQVDEKVDDVGEDLGEEVDRTEDEVEANN